MMKAGYAYIWEFEVRSESIDRFTTMYGSDGEWSQLFRTATGYVRTDLHRDLERPERFLTVDHWESKEDYIRFRERSAARIDEIDRLGADLTRSERFLGDYSTI